MHPSFTTTDVNAIMEKKHNEAQKMILYISNIHICTNVTLHYIYLFLSQIYFEELRLEN